MADKQETTKTRSQDNKQRSSNKHTVELVHDTEMDALDQQYQQELPPMGCGILGRYPVLSVIIFAMMGIGIGVGLSYWQPEDPHDKDVAIKWIGLVGDMFIRALKAIVLPLVFLSVALSVVDMMSLGRASSVGWLTMGLYLFTTVVAAILGVISIASLKGYVSQEVFTDAPPPEVTLGCNQEGFYITELPDGTLACTNQTNAEDNTFFVTDLNGAFVKTSSGTINDISLSDTIYDGIFTKLITANITQDFVDANFAAVVMFAIVFGFALGRVVLKRFNGHISKSTAIAFFKELESVFVKLINWVIMLTPFAVLSLITRAIGTQDNLKEAFGNVGYLILAFVLAWLVQYFVVYTSLLTIVLRSNPFAYLKHMLPAQTMAFACASSAATIPMTLRCVKSTGIVPDAIGRFVVPLGATINMDGGAIYFPVACIWLAVLNGIEPDIASYFLLIVIATVGSAGTAPVPSASLVLIITAYNTVFNSSGTPNGFEFILAIDWFMDRLRTILNVTGDTVCAGLVATMAPLNETDDEDSHGEAKDIEKVADEEMAQQEDGGSSTLHA